MFDFRSIAKLGCVSGFGFKTKVHGRLKAGKWRGLLDDQSIQEIKWRLLHHAAASCMHVCMSLHPRKFRPALPEAPPACPACIPLAAPASTGCTGMHHRFVDPAWKRWRWGPRAHAQMKDRQSTEASWVQGFWIRSVSAMHVLQSGPTFTQLHYPNVGYESR